MPRVAGRECFNAFTSSPVRSRHLPGARLFKRKFPIATLTRRNVGCPTTAVIRLTWRLRPSCKVISSQVVGTFLRNRTGGSRGGRLGSPGRSFTCAGRVRFPWIKTPSLSCRSAASSGVRSTCTQYARGCSKRGSVSRCCRAPSSVSSIRPSLS